MLIAYFDCFAGISGEMLLGALIGAGLSFDVLQESLSALHLDAYKLELQIVARKELSGTYVSIAEQASNDRGKPHHNSKAIKPSVGQDAPPLHSADQIIGESTLPVLIKQTSLAIFRRLAQAGAVVAPQCDYASSLKEQISEIVAVVGVVTGLSLLGIGRVECSPIHVGSGMIYSAEGIRPALSPVSAEILRSASVPVYGSSLAGELVTPVGAAIITTIASAFGAVPAMKIGSVGYGAGKYDLSEAPNLVRLFIGETVAPPAESKSSDVLGGRPGSIPHSEFNVASSVEHEPATQSASNARPFVASNEEWATLTIKGHQHSGRQRLAS